MATTQRFGAINSARLDNLTATTDPTATDDSGDGYGVGSLWLNVSTDHAFVCLDATVSGAVWSDVTANVLVGGGSLTLDSALALVPEPVWLVSDATTRVLTNSVGLVTLTKIYAPIDVVRLTIPVSTIVASSSARVAVYSADGATKLIDTTIATTTPAGAKTTTVSSTPLTPGYYWMFICRNDAGGGSPAVRVWTLGPTNLNAHPTAGLADLSGTVAVTSGAAPSSITIDALTGSTDGVALRLDSA
jgi:hypothetical protein